jgi:hypothetical protein
MIAANRSWKLENRTGFLYKNAMIPLTNVVHFV